MSTIKSLNSIFLLVAAMASCLVSACASSSPHDSSSKPPKQGARSITIIGHRGACGYRPEHTLASYELAIEMGADFIEPDLVMTKDGVLIARHENDITATTDAPQKFPERKKTKTIDGAAVTGWFTEDFTLAEMKTLRAKERLATRSAAYNGRFQIPTFTEVVELAKKRSLELGRPIGIYPEMKHPSYFASIGLPLEAALAAELQRVGWTSATDPVVIQSFELGALRRIHSMVGCRLVFLYDEPKIRPFDGQLNDDPRTYGDYAKPAELQALSKLLYGIGPYKRLIIPAGEKGSLQAPTSLIEDAHRAGLVVHPYTFRSDAPFLDAAYGGDPSREYLQFFKLGVDGVFSDFSDDAVRALEKFNRE